MSEPVNPLLRVLSASLAVWMALLPSVGLASQNKSINDDRSRIEAKRLAATKKMRAETGADPEKLAAHAAEVSRIEQVHLPSRLAGLSMQEEGLRDALGKLNANPSEHDREALLDRVRAHATALGAAATKIESLTSSKTKTGKALAPKLAAKLAPAIKLSKQLAAVKGLKAPSASSTTAALSKIGGILAKAPGHKQHVYKQAPKASRLTAVTPRTQQASRDDLRRSHPLLASASDAIFRVANRILDLDNENLSNPVAQDLLATPEAPLSAPIVALATKLQNDPRQIYLYVRNQIQSEPYFGSKKGALGTLLEGSGNDYDQASLLIALLRAAGISSRYEVGQIQMSTRQAMDFTNTDDPTMAVEVMDTIGMPAIANLAPDNSVVSVNLDLHPWVRAYVPYTNYRGTPGPGSTSVWVRLDPSIKATNRQPPAFVVGNNVTFNFGNYLSGATPNSTTQSPLQIFESQLTTYVNANNLGCDSLDKLLPTNAIIPVVSELLPSELEVTLLKSESVADALDPYTDYGFEIQLDNGGISPQQLLPAIYGQPIALRYVGASTADQAAIHTAGSTMTVSPLAATLQPQLLVNNVVVWQGAHVAPGTPQKLLVNVNVPGLPQASMPHDLGAGGVYAIGLATSHPTDAQLAAVKSQIATTQAAVTAGTATADDLDEARAQALALTYLHHIDRDEKRIFGYSQNVGVKDVTEILAGHYVSAATLFGMPVTSGPGSWRVDVAREANTPFSQVADMSHLVALNELAGFQGSHWENRLFQEVFNTGGLSSTNGCQLAVAGGGTLLTLTVPGTSNQLVGYDQDSIAEIEAGLQAGEVVTVPKSTFAFGAHFTNVIAYVITDPVDGTALYREGSSFNGGENSGPTPDFQNGGGCPMCDGTNQQTASYVNLANGNYFFSRTDLTLPAVGIPIAFTRAYDSRSAVTGVLGNNWWHSYERKVVINADGSADYTTAEGQLIQKLHFTKPPVGQNTFGGPAGWHLKLVNNGAGYTLTYRDGRFSSFDVNGYLLSDSDLNGNTVTLQRNADHTIHTVTDATGRVALTFAYAGGYLASVTDVAARIAQFGQTGADLTSAKDALNQTERYAYDAADHLVGRTDKNGNLWTIVYDANGRWDLETDPTGNSMAAAYDNGGLSTVYTDRRGYSRVTTYNTSGNPVTVVDPGGNVHKSTWDTDSNKLTETDERGNVTRYTYTSDGLANFQSIFYPDGSTAQWSYAAFSRPSTITNPMTSTTNTYDANGNLKTSKDGFNNTTTYTYLPTGQLQTILAPGNAVATAFAYNADGTLHTITDPFAAVTTIGYDAAGHFTSLADPGTHTRSMTADALGNVLTMTDALTNATTFTYDSEGKRTTLKDSTNAVSIFGHDALNRLTTVTDAQGHLSKTGYDPEGNVLTQTDANGNVTVYTYDESGRLTSATDALGNVTSQGYCADVATAPCQTVDPDGNVTIRTIDSMGRVTQVSDGAGEVTQTVYSLGVPQKTVDARGNATTYNFSYGRLSGYSTPVNNVGYTYDTRGNRATVVFGGGTTTYTYDANNRLLTEKNPLNKTTTYTYNLDGTRATKTDANSHLTTYGYDANKRLTSVTFADATSFAFAYDSRGHRTTETSPAVTRTLTFNNLGELATAQDGLTAKTITYGYDAVGNRTSLTYDGLTTSYAYDAARRLTALTDPTGEVTAMAYDPAGNRTQLAQGNGIVTAYAYDQANRMAQIASPIQRFGYTYDLAGNPYVKAYADGTSEQFTYDAANEVTGITRRNGASATLAYSNGNLSSWPVNGTTNQSSSVNAFNQITTIYSGGAGTNGYTYTFDNDGNRLTQAVQPPGSGPPPLQTTTYTWNDDDRMSGVTLPSSATNAYGYDANGIRVSKRDSSGNINYLVDPQTQSILATYDATLGTRLTVYNQNPQKVDEIVSYQSGVVKYYPHADMLGSVYALSDSTAKAIATWTYDVYGARTQVSGALSYPFGFTGREHDPDTGLIYSRRRYYDPNLASWLSPDPYVSALGQNGGDGAEPGVRALANGAPYTSESNRYLYSLDRPTVLTDPTGMWVSYIGLAGTFAAGLGITSGVGFACASYPGASSAFAVTSGFAIQVSSLINMSFGAEFGIYPGLTTACDYAGPFFSWAADLVELGIAFVWSLDPSALASGFSLGNLADTLGGPKGITVSVNFPSALPPTGVTGFVTKSLLYGVQGCCSSAK